jgi:hypothetical protein
MTLLGSVVFTLVLQGNAIAARIRSEQRLAALRDAMEAFYRDHAIAVEDATPGVLPLVPSSPVRNGALLDAASATTLASYLPGPLGDGLRDGYGRPFRIFVSDVLHPLVGGTTLATRRIAIVSSGPDGRFESASWDAANGILGLQGDDAVAYVDGLLVQRVQVEETRRRMARIATLLRAIAGTRFLANTARDITIDYFGAGPIAQGWDEGSAFLRGVDRPSGPAGRFADAEIAALGISRSEALDAWGGDLSFDNDSGLVRQPGNPAPGRNTPPWSARLVARLPGGGTAVESIDGVF